ncbi:MAG: ATP-dependent DNA helicase RecG [Oscillospiraceae bacterium]|nr:ATP-dependent DNA helicase RecG [Oscillospiraceae bacterium]MBQ7341604.1 ATP-dependent DNA helicase RecG [Oscillospiraceae bacterium]
MAKLTDPVTILKGVGPTKAKQFAALNIHTLQDLICHFPRGYEDRTKLVTIEKLEVDKPACFKAMVMNSPRTTHIRKGLDITKVQVADHTARLNITFFNQKYTAEQLQYGSEYIFYGAVSGDFIGYNMTSPSFEALDSEPITTRRVLPIYPLTSGLSNASMLKAVRQALAICDPPEEIIPEEIRREYGILPAERAYYAIHEPASMAEAELAKKRLIFEEFFVFSAGLSLMRAARAQKRTDAYANCELSAFYSALPFTLTGAQQRAIGEIVTDFRRGTPMNRLVQGDVGSGKTMVAAAAAYLTVKNGRQAALMVPTEILAEQHYQSLQKLLAPLGVRVSLLTGSLTQKQKKDRRAEIESGQADLVIGTHALVSETTVFDNLGLVITDEQHRFGVAQRSKLSAKGNDPHLLVMSATPIPRTLALIMYGDLEVSILDELPPGREPVDSFLVGENMRFRINAFIRKQVSEGHQCFVVCPAVEETEDLGIKAATVWADTLKKTVFPDLRIALLHGQMKGAEKEAVMTDFAAGNADVLVATTVIEVGVDVPNATLMVIEDADRFGLSQLHQLRGRVGRGKAKSYCILTTHNKNNDTLHRLKALCSTNDGFKIAEEDLQMRGPGDFFGSRQSGLPVFRVANLSCDLQTLKQAQQASARWIDTQGTANTPEAVALRQRIGELFLRAKDTMN